MKTRISTSLLALVLLSILNPQLPTLLAQATAFTYQGRLDSTASTFGSVFELRNSTASPAYLGAINFNNATGTFPGQIGYTGSDALAFRTGGAEHMRLDSDGRLDVTAPSSSVSLNVVDVLLGLPFTRAIKATSDGLFGTAILGLSENGDVMSLKEDGTLFVKVLTITGGADIAEPFTMSEKALPKGAVVVIDEANPGKLKLSTEPYDRKVAGIISGAGGVNPGLSLSQQGRVEGDQQVALTGRVYVQADASGGAIKPGDLLTTSATPGQAMKVTDHPRAQGAILGKAMTGLKAGQGLVLVLVTLQ